MPTLASTSRAQLAYILESVFGTTPVAGNGAYLRMTGESLNFDVTKETSKEIRSDRQTSSQVPVGAQAGGGFNFELSYNEFDAFFASTLQDAWSVYGTNGVGSTFSGTFTTTTITAGAAPVGANAFTTLKKGQWFRLLAPTDSNDGKLLRVSTITSPTSTVITLDASTPLVAAGPIANCALQTSRLVNGTTKTSFSIEKSYNDVTQFFLFKGMTPSKLSLKFASAALTTGSFEFAASKAFNIQNAVTGVGQLWEGTGPLTSSFIKSLSLDYDNSLRPQQAIGTFGLVGVGNGTIALKGSLEVYFADGAIYDKFIANTNTQIIIATQDEAGNGYVFTMPVVNLSNGKIVAGAKDQDLMATFDFMALSDDSNADATLRKTLIIDRVGVAAT
jgi:hypothetical protein